MAELSCEQTICGLKERLNQIVSDLKGDYDEVEIVKQMLIDSELLLAEYNVKSLFTSNLDICDDAIKDEETGEVRPDMKRLASCIEVVSIDVDSEPESCTSVTTVNFRISEELTYQVVVVFLRSIDEDEETDEVKTTIHYILKVGHLGDELVSVVDFEFVHDGYGPGEDDDSYESSVSIRDLDKPIHIHGPDCSHSYEKDGHKGNEEDNDEIVNLHFDMEVMDLFTKESEVSISSEDMLCYLIGMEFWEEEWEIADRLADIIEEIRHPDPNTVEIIA